MALCVFSVRWIGEKFVEGQSAVEKVLREDPQNAYVEMDFSTRDEYRHVVEKLAKKTELSEREVARTAVTLASKGGSDD